MSIDIRRRGDDGQWHPTSVHQQFIFHARFGTIRRVWAVVRAAQRRTHIGAITALPLPLNAVAFILVLKANAPDVFKDLGIAPFPEPGVNRCPRPKLRRHFAPRDPAAQNVKDAIEHHPIIGRWTTTVGTRRSSWNFRFNQLPQLIRYFS